jgi:hypothetical protein
MTADVLVAYRARRSQTAATVKSPLFPAEKFAERLKKFRDRFRDRFDALCELARFAAMNGAGLRGNFIGGQNDFVSGTRHLAPGRGQGVRSRANGYTRHRHRRLERVGRVTRR